MIEKETSDDIKEAFNKWRWRTQAPENTSSSLLDRFGVSTLSQRKHQGKYYQAIPQHEQRNELITAKPEKYSIVDIIRNKLS